MPLRLLSRLAAALVAAAGLALIVIGALKATALAPPAQTVGRISGSTGAGVIDTATGILALDGPRVTVQVTPRGSSGPVFIGVGRADDVAAYLGGVRRDEITRVSDSGTLTLTRTGTEATVPDPVGVDIWAASAHGTGSTTLTWPRTAGQWRIVVAADGSGVAPQPITMTWARDSRSSGAARWIGAGVVLLVLGAAGSILDRFWHPAARPQPDGSAAGRRGHAGAAAGDGAEADTENIHPVADDPVPDDLMADDQASGGQAAGGDERPTAPPPGETPAHGRRVRS